MTNAYDLLDKELDRMHKLLVVAMEMARQPNNHFNHPYGYSDGGLTVENIWARISLLQKVIADSYQVSDKELQEKIAEMALVGRSDKDSQV